MGMSQSIILREERQRDYAMGVLKRLNIERPWEITIKPYRKKRSRNQNALMWKWIDKVVGAVHDHTGQDKDDIHGFFKDKFLTPKRVEIGGEIREYRTTTNLTTKEMAEYMNQIHAWVTSELGLFLPIPETRVDE